HPFLAGSWTGVLQAITTQVPPPPSRLNPQVPAALDALIVQMLAKDARLRPTAAEVDAALTELAAPEFGRAAPASPPPARRHTVGREPELAALHAASKAASAGQGLVVCVTGEPGLGKTTLVEGFLEGLAGGEQSYALARGRCSERLAGAEAYLPLLEAL